MNRVLSFSFLSFPFRIPLPIPFAFYLFCCSFCFGLFFMHCCHVHLTVRRLPSQASLIFPKQALCSNSILVLFLSCYYGSYLSFNKMESRLGFATVQPLCFFRTVSEFEV